MISEGHVGAQPWASPPERRIAASLNRPLVRYAALRGRQGPTDLQASSGSVAHIARDSLRDSMVLVGLHEQTHTPDLPHDELALLSGQ